MEQCAPRIARCSTAHVRTCRIALQRRRRLFMGCSTTAGNLIRMQESVHSGEPGTAILGIHFTGRHPRRLSISSWHSGVMDHAELLDQVRGLLDQAAQTEGARVDADLRMVGRSLNLFTSNAAEL